MELLQKRIEVVDSLLPSATLALDHLTENERLAAAELADYFYCHNYLICFKRVGGKQLRALW